MSARAAMIVALLGVAGAVAACTTTAEFDYGGTGTGTTVPPTQTAPGSPVPTGSPVVAQHVISTPANDAAIKLIFPGKVQVGDVVAVTASCASTTSITSVSDAFGNTWAIAGTEMFSTGEPVVVYWTKVAVGGSGFTITVADGATASQLKALAVELTGVSTPSHFAGAAGNGASITTGSVVVSSGALAFSTTVVHAATTLSAFDGATMLDQAVFGLETFGDEARRATTTTSMRCAFTSQANGSWACARVCFLP